MLGAVCSVSCIGYLCLACLWDLKQLTELQITSLWADCTSQFKRAALDKFLLMFWLVVKLSHLSLSRISSAAFL